MNTVLLLEKEMKKLTIEECKERQINILKNVDSFCKINNLKYVLAYGTLLGAIRHNGFIPWDDDIDIMMPREDYDKFCNLFIGKNLKLMCCDTDSDYPYPFAKVIDANSVLFEDGSKYNKLGVYIDVFPMDYRPSSINYNKFCRKIEFWNRVWLYKSISNSAKCSIVHKIYHEMIRVLTCLISCRHASDKVRNLIHKYANSKSNIIGLYSFRGGIRFELPYDAYFDIDKHVFENMEFNIPKQYDLVLSKIYGDYMCLPPIDCRNSGHNYTAYERD